MTLSVIRRFTGSLLALAFIASCTKDSSSANRRAAPRAAATPRVDDSAAGSIDLSTGTPYAPTSLSATGSLSGTIRIVDSASLGDSAAAAVPECAPKRRAPKAASPAKSFGNTVVWIANVKSGKPLPVEKRVDLSSDDCLLDPRVQAVVVGTTVNVINDEKVLHRLVFTKLGTHDTLTVTPFFNVGQIVASERLAKSPGIVEVRCARHPWTHGYIAVFDHPYFAVTEANGSFKIDSLPPGSYKAMIWHEGDAKPIEQQVKITAGGTATITR